MRRLVPVAVILSLAAVAGVPVSAQPEAMRSLDRVTGEGATVRVIGLHPWGGRPRAFMRSLGVDSLGCRARWRFVEGPRVHPPGFAWFEHLAGDADQRALASEVRGVAARLATWLRAEAGAERSPTIVVGYSQGAMLALGAGVLHADQIDAVVSVSGTLPRALWPRRGDPLPSFRFVHGRRDPFVPFEETAALHRRLESLGASSRLVTSNAAHRFGGPLRRGARRELRAALEERGACEDRGASGR